MNLDISQAWRELFDLIGPVMQHDKQCHIQVRPGELHVLQGHEEAQGLDGLARNHLVECRSTRDADWTQISWTKQLLTNNGARAFRGCVGQ